MRAIIDDLVKYRTFLSSIVSRDVKKKYHGSVLGVAWCVLDPILNTIVLTLVFSYIIGRNIPAFPLYIMSGRMIFNFTSGATTMAMSSIAKNSGIINKIYTPKYMFVVSDMTVALINQLFAFIPLIPLMIFYRVPFSFNLLFFIPVLILLTVFTLGLCLVLAPYGLFYKDLTYLYGIFTTLWFFLTPIIYTMDSIDPRFRFLWRLNPMTHFVDLFRSVMHRGEMPSLESFMIAGVFAVVMFGLGCVIFKESQDRFFMYI